MWSRCARPGWNISIRRDQRQNTYMAAWFYSSSTSPSFLLLFSIAFVCIPSVDLVRLLASAQT